MPLTPQAALAKSTVAFLSEEEKVLCAGIIERVEASIVGKFVGAPMEMIIEPCGIRVASRVARAFVMVGWNVTLTAMDGQLGKAGDLLAAGAPVNWRANFAPDWRASTVNGTPRH